MKLNDLYRTGIKSTTIARDDRIVGASMIWQGASRGRSMSDLYGIGTGRIAVGGATSTIVDFMMNIAHILLIATGLYVLVSNL